MGETIDLSEFRGGVKDGLAATDFSSRQWTSLRGVMFEPDGRVRSQWGARTVASGGLEDVLLWDGLVAGVDGAGAIQVWELPGDGDDTDGVLFGTFTGPVDGSVRPLGVVPWLVADKWVSAGLFGSVVDGTDAVLLFRDGGSLGTATFSERYPNNATSGALPYGNVAATWGDFLLLGDVRWNLDPDVALSSTNATRRPNGVWYSKPAKTDGWEAIDMQFAGNADGTNRIVGLFPLDVGLLIATTDGIHLFRGNAVDSEPELLRSGIGPQAPEHVAYWPTVGAVVWTDQAGRVWHTNGREFGRLDRPLPVAEAGGPVGALGDNVFVVRDGRLWCFNFETEDGAWTELQVPGSGQVTSVRPYRNGVYLTVGGVLVRMSPELPWRAAGPSPADGLPVEVVSATLAVGDGHDRTFWHRFGVRAGGSGRIVEAECRPGPWVQAPSGGLTWDRPLGPEARLLRVWPAHGPSTEASFGFVGEGDLTVEGMTVWTQGGRPDRG